MMNQDKKFPPSRIIDTMDEYIYKTAILRAALQMKVWDKVAKGLNTAETMAADKDWDLQGTQMLLRDLCHFKLLKMRKGKFFLTKETECYLLSDKPSYMGKFLLNEYHWEGEGQLAETIRTGKRPIRYDAADQDMVDVWLAMYVPDLTDTADFVERMNGLWKQLDIQFRSGMRVLDIACGPAPRTLILAQQHPDIQVTLLDRERIVQIALDFAHRLGVDHQVQPMIGDLWSTEIGSNQFDLVYMGNITHFFSPEENTRIFQKINRALVPSGNIAINAIRQEYPQPQDPELRYYALSKGGAAYTFEEYRMMLEQAGFSCVQDVARQPIKAVKP
jgi:C-methyltransferase